MDKLSNSISLPEKVIRIYDELQAVKEELNQTQQNIKDYYVQKNHFAIVPQSEQQMGIITALVVETIDIWKQNRVRFFCPLFHDPNRPIKSLPWAYPISPFGGFDDCGVTWVPPAGATVCIAFEGGHAIRLIT